MTVADLSEEAAREISEWRYDRIVEKHEGPFRWKDALEWREPEFLEVDGRWVLLPVSKENHPHISVLRTIVSQDGNTLTIFLKDTTFVDDPKWEPYSAGFVAVCDRLPGEEFYVAVLYHEWFILSEFPALAT